MAGTNQYLIDLIFEAKGVEKTEERVKKITKAIDGLGKPVGKTVQQMGDFERAMKRVAVVVPVWMAARMALQAILTPIKELGKALMELDTGLAKVATVSRISASEQKKFFADLQVAAFKYYTTSSASMKEITEAMYQIGTAGRTVTEIMQGFSHVLDLSIATFGNVVDAGRTLTGVLNVYGDSMPGLVTSNERMRYIADLLTYTWSNNQVELNEISTAMGYVGAAGDMLNVDLKTLVGTIGFLNTGLLRGSKAGTSLLNAFIQIAASSDKLRNLGVVFDPRRPLDLIDVMTQLHNKFLESGNTLAFTEDLFDIFGKRGGRAIALIMQDWDNWIKRIRVADSEFTKFAENTRETAEKTLPKAFGKFFKLGVLGGKTPTINPLTQFFNNQAKQLEKNIELLEIYRALIAKGYKLPPLSVKFAGGDLFGGMKEFVGEDLAKQITPLKEFFELIGEAEISAELAKQTEENANNLASAAERAKNLFDTSAQLGYSWEHMVSTTGKMLVPLLNMTEEELKQSEHLKKIYEYRLKNLNVAKKEESVAKGISTGLKQKLEQDDLEVKYSLMKIAGAEDEELAYTKITDKVNELNNLAKQENERRKSTGQEVYKMISLTDILNGNWKNILNSGLLILDKEKDITEFEKLRASIITGLNQKYQKQVDTLRDLAMQYEKADAFEKSRLRRVAELATMTPEELRRAYESSAFDKNLIIDYWDTFTKEAQNAIIETTTLFKDMINKIPKEEITGILNIKAPEIATTMRTMTPAEQAKIPPITNITNVGAQQVNVTVEATGNAEEIATLLTDKVKQELLLDEDFRNAFARRLIPIL